MSDQPNKPQSAPGGTPNTPANGWFVPKNAVTEPPVTPARPEVPLPEDNEPQRTGAWYVPAEAAPHVAKLPKRHRVTNDASEANTSSTEAGARANQAVVTPAASNLSATLSPQDGQSATPIPAPQPEPSGTVDYSNYVPGVGFVDKSSGSDADNSGTTGEAPTHPEPTPQKPAQPVQVSANPVNPYVSQPVASPAGLTPGVSLRGARGTGPLAEPQAAPKAVGQGVSSDQLAASLAKPATSSVLAQKFNDVERSVQVLRRRYTAGSLSRDQLQAELRKLMILDSEGHWWMIGLESDKWYKYNGKDWVPSTPPGRTSDPAGGVGPVGLSGIPTATVDQPAQPAQPIAQSPVQTVDPANRFNIPLDDFGMPLPQRVPVEDMGATIVGKAAPRLDNTLKTDAPVTVVSARNDASNQGVSPYDGGVTVASTAQAGGAITVPGTSGTPPASDSIESPKLSPIAQPDYGPKPGGWAVDKQRSGGCLVRAALIGTFAALALALLAVVGAVVGYMSIVNNYAKQIDGLAGTVQAETQSVQIFDSTNRMIYQLNDPNVGARIHVQLADISPNMIHAVIATENKTFYTDPGFDPIRIVGAVVQNLRAGETVSGASTITQELTRNKILDAGAAADRSASRKITEIIVSSEVSRRYTKSQILEDYLNTVYFGNLAYGIEAAAQTYFNKHAKDLNVAESSFLAGIIQSPVSYDPANHSDEAIKRAKYVRDQMLRLGCIQMEHDPYSKQPFCITQDKINGAVLDIAMMEAQLSSFQPKGPQMTYPHFVTYIQQQLEKQFGQDALYNSAFNVYTTIDPKIQDQAQQAVQQQVTKLARQNVTNGAVFAVDPQTGAIKAMVGSADFYNKQIDGQFNVVFGARQPGSSIKPFVYMAALEKDPASGSYWTPATVIWDVPTDFNGYKPLNYFRNYNGPQTVRVALASSLNIPAVKTLNYVGIDRFKALAQRFGLTFPLTQPENAGLPMALGGIEVPLYDMVHGYSVFANGGKQVDLYGISKITRREAGKEVVVFEQKPQAGTQVAQPELTYLITSILSDDTARSLGFGRNSVLNLRGITAAVKTGTTNDSKDNWTIGYTPNLVVGVWVGNSNNSPMIGTSGVTGAAPIWAQVMTGALAGTTVPAFNPPAEIRQTQICADFGTLNFQECRNPRNELYFTAEAIPAADTVFVRQRVDSFSNKIANQNCPDYVQDKIFVNITDQSALNWLNTSKDGAAFLAQYSLTPPIVAPPKEACDANTPRPVVKIANPIPGSTVQGLVQILGSVYNVPAFAQYTLEVGQGFTPTAFTQVDGPYGVQQTADGSFLGRWDTTKVANGDYTLRLSASNSQGNTAQVSVQVRVNNVAVTPTTAPVVQPTIGGPIIITATPSGAKPGPVIITATPAGLQGQPLVQPTQAQATPFSMFPPTKQP